MKTLVVAILLVSISVLALGENSGENRHFNHMKLKRIARDGDGGYGPPSGYGHGGYGPSYYSPPPVYYAPPPSYGHGGYRDNDKGSSLLPLLPLLALAPLALMALGPLFTAGVMTGTAATTGATTGAGTIAATTGRKKREIFTPDEKVDFAGFLDVFSHSVDAEEMQEKLMAAYITCSMDENAMPCLQQLACQHEDWYSPNRMTKVERKVASTILGMLMTNRYVSPGIRSSIAKAAQVGKHMPESCTYVYKCKLKN